MICIQLSGASHPHWSIYGFISKSASERMWSHWKTDLIEELLSNEIYSQFFFFFFWERAPLPAFRPDRPRFILRCRLLRFARATGHVVCVREVRGKWCYHTSIRSESSVFASIAICRLIPSQHHNLTSHLIIGSIHQIWSSDLYIRS